MLQGLSYPQLHHPELQALFEQDMTIPHELVQQLLDLPRVTLIEDLCAMLHFATEKSEKIFEIEDYSPEFMQHSLWMLIDLKAVEALPAILDFLRGCDDGLVSYLADGSDLWEVIFALGQNNLADLKVFLLDNSIPEYNKAEVATAVSQMGLHLPQKRAEVVEWFSSLMDFSIENPAQFEDENAMTTITFVTGYAGELRDESLFPKAKKLYDLGLMDYSIEGDWEEYKGRFIDNISKDYKRNISSNIFERYHIATTTWDYYQEKLDPEGYKKRKAKQDAKFDQILTNLLEEKIRRLSEEREEKKTIKPVTSYLNQPKVSRNDDCPCGSGKKYKRCCGK